MGVELDRLTAIVRTCDRPKGIARLVRSLRRHAPGVRILVADDSGRPSPVEGADAVRVPADLGTSAARNALLARVRTPYFLLLEDNMELDRRSRVERLMQLVASGRLDIAAGDCCTARRLLFLLTRRTPEPAHAVFDFTGDVLQLRSGARTVDVDYHACDVAHNFFVGRTDKIRAMGGWDPQLAVDERIEFFVRAQRFGLRVGMDPMCIAARWVDRRADAHADRKRNFRSLALAKIGVSRLVDIDGSVTEAVHLRAA